MPSIFKEGYNRFYMLWKVNDDHASDCLDSLAEEFGISQILSKLLALRGSKTKKKRNHFKAFLKSLSDPFEVSYLKEGVEYLSQAIDQKASILFLVIMMLMAFLPLCKWSASS